MLNTTGGFVFGETYDRLYNPVGLIQESVAGGHPVVYVGVNFRLGSMPFHDYMIEVCC